MADLTAVSTFSATRKRRHSFYEQNLKLTKNNTFKAVDQPDHMIDIVIFLPVKYCLCKIWYQVKHLRDHRKSTKDGLSTHEFQ